jgi:dihydroorotase
MIRLILSMALLIQAASGQEIYDLLLKNGNVIDAANRRSGRFDIAVIGTKIRRVGRDLPGAHARVVIDASQYYVTPGLIDIHTHFDAQAGGLNLQPEHNAFPAGVTTAVDAGSSDWTKFEEFKAKVIDHSKVRLLAFLEMGNDAQTDPEAVARMARKYSQVIAGIKTFGGVEQAIKVAELSNTIVMVEPSPQSGQQDADSLLKHMRPGDIYTHMYGRIGPQLESMLQARKRGLLFDVGHGSGGFWFRIAAPAINRGLLPDTISTDIDKNGVMLSRANMTTTMSKLINLGMTLEQVIERATIAPARAIRHSDLGSLSEGAVADIAVLELQKGSFGFLDSGHGRLIGGQRLRCVLTVRNGSVVWDSEGLCAPDWIKAGPYTNFR